MGSSASKEDEKHLLEDEEEIQPIFKELRLVLIGSQGAGKNTVANAIFKEKVFTFWTSCRSFHIMKTRTVSGTRIHLARTPGWNGDLSRSEKAKREIIHCVQTLYKTGPHAVILVINVNSVLSKSNFHTLENLLTVQLWNHTIVLFTNGEKLGHYSIEDHIRSEELQSLIDKCGKRYFVIRNNDSNQINETIQELVAMKNSASFFNLSSQTEDYNTLLSDLKCLVKRIKSKISSVLRSKEELKNKQKNKSIKKMLKSKDAEIKRLKYILQEKEREIKRLESRPQDSALVRDLQRRNEELEHQLSMKIKEGEEKDAENKRLKKELQKYKTELTKLRSHENQNTILQTVICGQLSQNVTQVSVKSCEAQIELKDFSSNGSVLRRWNVALLEILEELSDDQLKRFTYLMRSEWNIPKSSVEDKDRFVLVDLIIETFGEQESVLKTRDLIMKIPRKDEKMLGLFEPFL